MSSGLDHFLLPRIQDACSKDTSSLHGLPAAHRHDDRPATARRSLPQQHRTPPAPPSPSPDQPAALTTSAVA